MQSRRTQEQADENPTLINTMTTSDAHSASSDVESQMNKAAVNSTAKKDPVDMQLNVLFWIVMSILSSTFLILINKVIMKSYEFTFVYSLTTLHFLAGAIATQIAASGCRAFVPKSIGLRENVIVAASAVGSVATMNLSLQYNSVGTYQMLKLLVIPCCMLVQYMFHNARFSSQIVGSLLVMLVGVATATITDVSFSSLGLFMGALAVGTTALFAIWQGSKQAQHKVDPQQLLHSIAPFQALLSGVCALIFDFTGTRNIMTHEFHSGEVVLIIASAFIAVLVNMSSMNLIGKTSPVSYQVVGHAKTCLILATGFFFMTDVSDTLQMLKNLMGVVIGLLGVFAYSYYKVKQG
jgi:solute carrier family 35 protein E3